MTYSILFIISFIVSIISIYFLREFAIKYSIYDEPGKNKIHPKSVPYFGGIGIFLGFTIALIFAQILGQIRGYQTIGIILGSTVILFIGFWDDLKWKERNRPFFKLFYQFLSGFLVIFILFKIGVNFYFSLSPILLIIIAVLYIVGIVNAINVDDGMDGLAGGIVGISLIGFIILSLLNNSPFIFTISGILLASILGFLSYNWHPASIFMGDSGSHFLGFLLATLAISFTGHPLYNFKQFIGPLLIIGFPLIDVSWVIVGRLINGKSPFAKGRNYLYDLLHLKFKFSTPKTVLICYLFQILLVISGILVYSL